MDEERRGEGLSASPAPPQRILLLAVTLLVCATVFSLFYAFRERRDAQQLALSQQQMGSTLDQTRSQLDALNAQLSALSARPAAPSAKPIATQHIAKRRARPARIARARAEDPRWKKVEGRLDEQQKLLASTQEDVQKTRADLQNNLTSTRDELNGSIAKTHDELVALEKRGERNYYEFDLTRSKQFQRVGPISLSLRKTNTKHENYTLMMLVEDMHLAKKNVNLYEPVVFYPADSTQPLQLVVNRIGKDAVHGYVSEPKYGKSDLTASKTANPGEASSSGSGGNNSPQTDGSLPHRPEPPR